ncbi:ABC transporter permease [Kribbella sindirgiensis]|uniref:ABC antibiotics transporter n=1 Tax=Kribbella sindirgiensis TaxID=1124744 RepID=A0A4V2M231_9ACTN|nr:ABC antibiotics transporter [Kribbella sindirgiensis]TCC21596.1 ABC antibiotics transporter [Kribbella sindirgiensis]
MNGFTGTAALARLAIRRDRFVLPGWIIGLTLLLAGIVAGLISGLSAQDLREETELNVNSPGLRLFGLASGASAGSYAMLRDYLTLAILAAVMSILAVVRHTRQAEETGRAELVGAAVVGRYASLSAAVLVTVAANVLLAAMLGLALVANGQPAFGSFTAGASVGAVGIVFAGVAAVTAQLSSTTRGAIGQAGAVLGVAFLLSGVGNMLGSADASGLRVVSAWPAWLSPIGWGEQVRPFDGNHWWPCAVAAAAFFALVDTAFLLTNHRDIGRGVLPDRRGNATAGRSLRGPIGLTWRLQRGATLGWAVAMLAFGVIFGAVSEQAGRMQGSAREWYARWGGTDEIVDGFLTSVIGMAGIAAAIYVVQLLLRMRSEETGGTLEPILSSAVDRLRWATSHILTASLGAAGLLLLFAIGTAATAGPLLDTPGLFGDLTLAALVQVPALLVVGAVVVALVAFQPRWSGAISWATLIGAILLGPLFGPTLGLPQWLQDISPFTHTPKAPAAEITLLPVITLVLISTVLASPGLLRLHRRDLLLPA